MSDLSPAMRAALLAYAVYSSNFGLGCLRTLRLNTDHFRDLLDPLEDQDFWRLTNLLDSIATIGECNV
jgi:hypothetical protein